MSGGKLFSKYFKYKEGDGTKRRLPPSKENAVTQFRELRYKQIATQVGGGDERWGNSNCDRQIISTTLLIPPFAHIDCQQDGVNYPSPGRILQQIIDDSARIFYCQVFFCGVRQSEVFLLVRYAEKTG